MLITRINLKACKKGLFVTPLATHLDNSFTPSVSQRRKVLGCRNLQVCIDEEWHYFFGEQYWFTLLHIKVRVPEAGVLGEKRTQELSWCQSLPSMSAGRILYSYLSILL